MVKTDKTKATTKIIGILGYRNCSCWVTGGILELFAVANTAAGMLRQDVRFRCEIISVSRHPVEASHGARFAARPLRPRYDAIIVPPLWCESLNQLDQVRPSLKSAISLLKRVEPRASLVCSTCSGAIMLADAGLLDGRQATLCWWLVDWFRERFPQVYLVADKVVAKDGKRWTAAAGTAYIHLCLDILKQHAPVSVLTLTSQLLLVEPRRGSQTPYLGRDKIVVDTEDALVTAAKKLIQNKLGETLSLASIATSLGISERTLHRRFRTALNLSPTAYIQSERVGRAKRLLEECHRSFEQIVAECGYEDAASFRKLFTRTVGISPGEYRLRFSRL